MPIVKRGRGKLRNKTSASGSGGGVRAACPAPGNSDVRTEKHSPVNPLDQVVKTKASKMKRGKPMGKHRGEELQGMPAKKARKRLPEVWFAYYGSDGKIWVLVTPEGPLERGDPRFEESRDGYLKELRTRKRELKRKATKGGSQEVNPDFAHLTSGTDTEEGVNEKQEEEKEKESSAIEEEEEEEMSEIMEEEEEEEEEEEKKKPSDAD